MLPKIHKNLNNPPGRPIISGNGCPTERISQFVAFFLQPGVKDIRSYIKDTTHFLSVLSTINTLPEGAILATLDVPSLYTNIPNREGIEACKSRGTWVFRGAHMLFIKIKNNPRALISGQKSTLILRFYNPLRL